MPLISKNTILEDVRNERAYFESDSDRAVSEMADNLTPIYNSDILESWRELPLDDSDRWQEIGAAPDSTIFDLMRIDLWLYYRDAVESAWAEIQDEHVCETELMPEITISLSGTLAMCSCGYKCAHWECACELNDHDHETN